MYKVKRGQTIRDAAEAFRLPESAIIACNRLDGEPREGEILAGEGNFTISLQSASDCAIIIRLYAARAGFCPSPARGRGRLSRML